MIKMLLLFLFSLFFAGCAASLYDQGRNSLDEGNYSQAISLYEEELKLNPDNYEAHRDMGVAYYNLNRLERSEASLNKALEGNREDGEAIFYLGLIAESREDYNKAIEHYRKLNSLNVSSELTEAVEGRIKLISKKKIEKEIQAALANEENLSSEPADQNSLAVLYFQNLGGKKELDPLQKGLAEMLITDLSQVKDLKIVERVKLQKLLDEMNLSSSKAFDQSTAPRIGRLIKANRLVKGSFVDLNESHIRVDAGFISTNDGSYQQMNEVEGDLENYFSLQKELAFNILNDMGVQISDEEREAIQVIPTESYLAFAAYSKGLDLEDKGMMSEAAEQYKEAVNLDPSFSAAGVKLQDTEQMIKASENFEASYKEAKATTSSSNVDRLSDSHEKLTGEVFSGRDDRNPNTQAGFGRGVKIDIEIILEKR